MASVRIRKRSCPRRRQVLHKPTGHIRPRVEGVGLQHVGIVCVDPHKARSKWMLADFFGSVLSPPSLMQHNRVGFDEVIGQVHEAIRQHQLGDVLVVIAAIR